MYQVFIYMAFYLLLLISLCMYVCMTVDLYCCWC